MQGTINKKTKLVEKQILSTLVISDTRHCHMCRCQLSRHNGKLVTFDSRRLFMTAVAAQKTYRQREAVSNDN